MHEENKYTFSDSIVYPKISIISVLPLEMLESTLCLVQKLCSIHQSASSDMIGGLKCYFILGRELRIEFSDIRYSRKCYFT